MWSDARVVMDELWVLSHTAERTVGRRLAADARGGGGGHATANVVLFGPYGDRARDERVARQLAARGDVITIFLASENTQHTAYADQMVGVVDISLGHRRDIDHPSYLRLPWWLPYFLSERHGLVFPPAVVAANADGGDAWRARPSFAALLSSHYDYPRRQLYELVSGLGLGRIDAPGKAFHNVEWPAGLPNQHLHGKVEFLSSYRFNVCPENSRTADGGYATEKVAQAHLAGTVPIYWGDTPLDPLVFNPARIIVYDGTNNRSVGDAVARLEGDEDYRREWFARPVLQPTAQAWLDGWVARFGGLLGDAMRRRGIMGRVCGAAANGTGGGGGSSPRLLDRNYSGSAEDAPAGGGAADTAPAAALRSARGGAVRGAGDDSVAGGDG